jgi:hypothetical protein
MKSKKNRKKEKKKKLPTVKRGRADMSLLEIVENSIQTPII